MVPRVLSASYLILFFGIIHNFVWPSVPVMLTCISPDHLLQKSSLISLQYFWVPGPPEFVSPGDFKPALTYSVGNLLFHLLLQKKQHLTVSLTDENVSAVGMGQGLPLSLPSLKYFFSVSLPCIWVCNCVHNQPVSPLIRDMYLHEYKFAKSSG